MNSHMSHSSTEAHLLLAIYDAAKAAGLSRSDVTTVVETMFGKRPEDLTLREAASVITHITGKIPVLPLL